MLYFKEVGGKEQIELKISKKKEITKIRMEISKTENKMYIKIIFLKIENNKVKACFI